MKINTFALLIYLVLFSLFSCQEKAETQTTNEPIQYLALGDSYTIGQGVDILDRWPNQLSSKLEQDGYTIEKTDIIAQTGWKTSDLLNAIEDSSLENYNLMSLLIGVNNQFSGIPFEIYANEFDELINQMIDAVGSNRIFVVSIPDYGVTPFGSNNSETIAQELDDYNEYARSRCQALNIPYINITEISRTLGASDGALASDNLHPSGIQYAEWVEKIGPAVIEIIGE
jgi:lysophospholipase L1-like esterase